MTAVRRSNSTINFSYHDSVAVIKIRALSSNWLAPARISTDIDVSAPSLEFRVSPVKLLNKLDVENILKKGT